MPCSGPFTHGHLVKKRHLSWPWHAVVSPEGQDQRLSHALLLLHQSRSSGLMKLIDCGRNKNKNKERRLYLHHVSLKIELGNRRCTWRPLLASLSISSLLLLLISQIVMYWSVTPVIPMITSLQHTDVNARHKPYTDTASMRLLSSNAITYASSKSLSMHKVCN